MAVKFLGATSTSVVGTSVAIVVPSNTSLKPGDIIFAFFTVQAFTVSTLVVPSGWILESTHPSVGDQIVFTALRYVDETTEPGTYTFTYAVSKPIVAVVGAYRGVQQNVTFSPGSYPFGYYAPAGSVGTANSQTSVTSVSTPSSGSSSLVAWGRSLFYFSGTHASVTPRLSDPMPLVAMRAKVETAKVSAMLCDNLDQIATNPLPAHTSAASPTLSGSIGYVRILEPLISKNDSLDSYKAKILRRMVPPPYGPVTFDEPLGQLLNSIGSIQNDVGGLFGVADFLPDEV